MITNKTANKIASINTNRTISLLRYALIMQFGRRFWLVACLPLMWLVLQQLLLWAGWHESFTADMVQNSLIGFPLYCFAIACGVRVVAADIEQRTLEVALSASGGAWQIWTVKTLAATLLMGCSLLIMSLACWLLFTTFLSTSFLSTAFPWGALIGVGKALLFFLILSVYVGSRIKSELPALVIMLGVLAFGLAQSDQFWSPLFNPLNTSMIEQYSTYQIATWTQRNHVLCATLLALIVWLLHSRSEHSEQLIK